MTHQYKVAIKTPARMCHGNISEFLNIAAIKYITACKNRPNVLVDLSRTNEVDILGVLLLYKYLEFTVLNSCFANPAIYLAGEESFIGVKMKEYGFNALFAKLTKGNKSTDNDMKSFKFSQKDNFFISPQILIRTNSENKENLSVKYLPKIEEYYNDDKIARMILTCISEIMINFWTHATADDKSILIAKGNSEYIEIACVDNGCGILTSVYNTSEKISPNKVITRAIGKGFTSKPNTDHMGRGLWVINEIAKRTKGKIIICSEGYMHYNNGSKTTVIETGYWKGAIFYLNLPTNNPITLSDFLEVDESLGLNFN